MKLLNHTTAYLSIVLLVIITLWGVIFYYAMLDEIYDSIDDGLDNQKGLVIQKASADSSLLNKNSFEEGDYSITRISEKKAQELYEVYKDTAMYMQNEKSYEPVRMLTTVFTQNGNYYQLKVVTSMVEEDDLTEELLYAMLWLYVGLLSTILLVNNFLLRHIWQPFNRLLNRLKDFRLENLKHIKYENTRVDEFRLLNETIQKLLQRNVDTYSSQKQFIENASHELQTPLAISINKLEQLAEHKGFSENELALLASALDNLERLTRLNRSLLLLSKIENHQFPEECEIDVIALVDKILMDFSDHFTYHSLTVQFDKGTSCVVKMNPDLASGMVTNLIKNAIVHNQPGGYIKIILTQKSFVVENSGSEEHHSEQLFDRFYKKQASGNSTGLGLAIVKAIAELYHFRLSYTYNEKHIFQVSFS